MKDLSKMMLLARAGCGEQCACRDKLVALMEQDADQRVLAMQVFGAGLIRELVRYVPTTAVDSLQQVSDNGDYVPDMYAGELPTSITDLLHKEVGPSRRDAAEANVRLLIGEDGDPSHLTHSLSVETVPAS